MENAERRLDAAVVPGPVTAELDGNGQHPRDSAAAAAPVVRLAGIS